MMLDFLLWWFVTMDGQGRHTRVYLVSDNHFLSFAFLNFPESDSINAWTGHRLLIRWGEKRMLDDDIFFSLMTWHIFTHLLRWIQRWIFSLSSWRRLPSSMLSDRLDLSRQSPLSNFTMQIFTQFLLHFETRFWLSLISLIKLLFDLQFCSPDNILKFFRVFWIFLFC